jgi:YD repeat-containing protein
MIATVWCKGCLMKIKLLLPLLLIRNLIMHKNNFSQFIFIILIAAFNLPNLARADYYQFHQFVNNINASSGWDTIKIYTSPSNGFYSPAELCGVVIGTQSVFHANTAANGQTFICSEFNTIEPSSLPHLLLHPDDNQLPVVELSYIKVGGNLCATDEMWNNNTQQCELPPLPDTPSAETVANTGESSCPVNGTNPINGATGNKYQRETDYTSSINNGVRFERYYNSLEAELKPGMAGDHWRSTYDRVVVMTVDANTSETVVVNYRPDGQGVFFVDNAGTWLPTIDLTLQLIELKDGQGVRIGWELTDSNDIVEAYDAEGKLISITNRHGQTQLLSYDLTAAQGSDDDSTTLDNVTGPFGRTLDFSYDVNGRLAILTDLAGESYSYAYDANDNLKTVTYPDETPLDSNDNPTRVYHYEDANFIHALTGITDETGNRFASWGYDGQGRGIFSEHAGGAERADVVYNVDGTTTITNSLGQVRTYHFETHNSVHVTSQIDGDQCVSCGGTAQNTIYDVNGFVASRTDFNGNITNYINDTRGLQTSRTEAVGSAEERITTTEWHASFRLPTKITEPGKETNFTYDMQGRLLERKEISQ